MGDTIRDVDPRDLRLPPSRMGGADPWKLHREIRQFGSSKDGMPPIWVYEDPDGLCKGSAMSSADNRIELFSALQDLSEFIPEMRVGQLMAAIGEVCADLHGRGLWDASDAELLEAVWKFRRNFEGATAETHQVGV